MNFYKRHLGDIAKSCGDLSQGQMGAYDLLTDWHYSNEEPLPLDMKRVYRIGRAVSKAERENVDLVLGLYFDKTPEGYTQKRALEEMAKANAQADTNRRIAEEREAKKRSRTEHESFHEQGNESSNGPSTKHQPSHKPLATSQEPSGTTTPSLPETLEATATEAGRACLLMRQAGCGRTNPSNANLLEALAEGVTPEKLADFAKVAVEKAIAEPFAYAIKAARNDRATSATVTPIKPRANDNFQGKSYVGTPDEQLPASLR